MTPLHIVLDGRVISDHFPGIGRYTYRLADALAHSKQIDLTLLIHPAQPNTHYTIDALVRAHPTRLHVHRIDVAPFTLHEQTRMPAIAREIDPDIWHAPYYIMPYRRLHCPTIVTFYDTIPLALPQFWSARKRLIFKLTNRLALRVADRVIAISQSTRRDLLHYLNVEPERVSVTPLAADERFQPQPDSTVQQVRQTYGLPHRYLLYLGINKPSKNLVGLVEAFTRASSRLTDYPHLVIAGAWDKRYPEARQVAQSSPVAERIHFIGPLPDVDLPALYASADWFVSSSLYEGFGLPLLEALACGTPVVCSNTSSLPEVVNEAALLFEPSNIDSIATALERAMTDAPLRATMRKRGLARAAQFSWARTAAATIKVYKAAFAAQASRR